MSKKEIQLIIYAILLCGLSVFVGWMFGFNFDDRNTTTGVFTLGAVLISVSTLIMISY